MTVIIKRNEDRNYDRLFAAIEEHALFGRRDAVSVAERPTAEGYAVEFRSLDAAVMEWLDARPRDFDVRLG